MQQWIPSAVASAVSAGAVALVYFLVRRMVLDVKADTALKVESVLKSINGKFVEVWTTMDTIRDKYMEEKTHELICGKNALELEKLFKDCLKRHDDAIFDHIREYNREMQEKMDKLSKSIETLKKDSC